MAHESIAATIGDHQFVQQLSKPNSGNKIERDFSFPQHFHGKLCASSTWRKTRAAWHATDLLLYLPLTACYAGSSQVARFLSRAENSFETGNNFSLFSRAFRVHCVCAKKSTHYEMIYYPSLSSSPLGKASLVWPMVPVSSSIRWKRETTTGFVTSWVFFFLLAITSARKGEPTLNQKGESPLMFSEVGVWWSVACCGWEWRWRQTDTKGKQF